MNLKEVQDFWDKWGFVIMGGIAFLFLFIVIVFYRPISRWLKDKPEIQFWTPTWTKKYGSSPTSPRSRFGYGKNEERCRQIFEGIFQRPFPKVRPNWLKRASTGKNLELDGYNPDLKLAFEYNGAQHAKFGPMHRGDIHAFQDQVERDRLKAQLCAQHGVTLISIPHTVKYEKLDLFIRNALARLSNPAEGV
jgi:hypothetical protein